MSLYSILDWKLGKYRVYRSQEQEGLFDPEVPRLPHSSKNLGFPIEAALVSLPVGCQFLGLSDKALGRLATDSESRRQATARLPEGVGNLGGVDGLGGLKLPAALAALSVPLGIPGVPFLGLGTGGLGCPPWMEREHKEALQSITQMQGQLTQFDQHLRAHMAKECQYLKSKGIDDCKTCGMKGLGALGALQMYDWKAVLIKVAPVALAFAAGVLIIRGLSTRSRPRRARNARRRNTVKLKPGQRWRRGSGEFWRACEGAAHPMGPFSSIAEAEAAVCPVCPKRSFEEEVTGRFVRPSGVVTGRSVKVA